MRIKGAHVLVTGASSGIGAELAQQLGRRGARLVLAARRVERLEAVADQVARSGAERPVVVPVDLSVPGEARRLATAAAAAVGSIDILVNNAGGGMAGLQWMASDGPLAREVFEINLWSPLALVAELVPPMRDRGSGTVVNVSSMSQMMTWPMLGHYSASKGALAMCTEALRLELIGTGVQVVEVALGPTDTATQGETRLVPGIEAALRGIRPARPERVAAAIARTIELDRDRLVRPRMMRLPYNFPGLVRALAPRQVRAFRRREPRELEVVMRAGSGGDDLAVRARNAWEAGERDLTELRRELASGAAPTTTVLTGD